MKYAYINSFFYETVIEYTTEKNNIILHKYLKKFPVYTLLYISVPYYMIESIGMVNLAKNMRLCEEKLIKRYNILEHNNTDSPYKITKYMKYPDNGEKHYYEVVKKMTYCSPTCVKFRKILITNTINISIDEHINDITMKIFASKERVFDTIIRDFKDIIKRYTGNIRDIIAQQTAVEYTYKNPPITDIGIIGNTGMTALHYACMYNNEVSAYSMIKNNMCVNLPDENGNTPLHYACKNKNYTIIKILMDNGADPDMKNKKGHSPKWVMSLN